MMIILNDGTEKTIRHYDHFRGMVSSFNANDVRIDETALAIHCDEGVFQIVFPTVKAVHAAVSNWRCLEGLPLSVNKKASGFVGRNNRALA
jgi:hypothetical protein